MPLDTIEPGKQLYTVTVQDVETKQIALLQYKSGAILTTEHDELIQYVAHQVVHFGARKIYTVSCVTPLYEEAKLTYVPVTRTYDFSDPDV
jgi:hypothetical protein